MGAEDLLGGKKSKKNKGKKDDSEGESGKRKKGSSGSSKRSKTDHKGGEIMYDGQQMQGQAQGYNVLSSTFPYDWTQSMRSPLMGPASGAGGVPAGSSSSIPQGMVDWNFRSKSPPAYGQQSAAASAENWMRSKSPMPQQAPNGHMQYSILPPEMAAMGYGQEAAMYPQMMYDPNSYGMTVSAHQQLSPNSQRKMMANEANMYMTNQMGFTGFFPGQQHAGYVAYTGTGDGMTGGGHQGGVAGQHAPDAYGGFEAFGVHGFENMGDHAAMMMGMNPGGNSGEHE